MDLGLDDTVPNEPLETIQEILRCRECDNSIDVKMIIEVAGSREGDNYMSLVKRLIVSGAHNKNQNENGKYAHLNFFSYTVQCAARKFVERVEVFWCWREQRVGLCDGKRVGDVFFAVFEFVLLIVTSRRGVEVEI